MSSTKSKCNAVRRIPGFQHLKHMQALQLVKMFNADILARSRADGVSWIESAEIVLKATGLTKKQVKK